MLIRLAPVVLVACLDQPVEVTPRGGGPPAHRLSELHLFDDVAAQRPAAGVVPYDVIAPLWSDGAGKLRFVAAASPIATSEDRWALGDGTYLVKTFYAARDERDPAAGVTLLETRVIARIGGALAKATYVWDADQRDATASGGNLELDVRWIDGAGVARTRTHHVPGTGQCGSCHRDDEVGLGLRTPELALPGQLAALATAGAIDRAPEVTAAFVDPYGDAALDARARSYLAMNCGHCHRPGGDAAGTGVDWRPDHVLDNVCRDAASVAGASRVIVPGAPGRSALITRMRAVDPYVHMPRGPSHVVDERGVAMLEAWIAALAPAGCP